MEEGGGSGKGEGRGRISLRCQRRVEKSVRRGLLSKLRLEAPEWRRARTRRTRTRVGSRGRPASERAVQRRSEVQDFGKKGQAEVEHQHRIYP